MSFWGRVSFIIFCIVGWNVIQWWIRVSEEASAKEEAEARRKKKYAKEEAYRDEIRSARKLAIEIWEKLRLDYVAALEDGDQLKVVASGRRFYEANRRYQNLRYQDQIIADEISIKNEMANRRANPIKKLEYEALDPNYTSPL